MWIYYFHVAFFGGNFFLLYQNAAHWDGAAFFTFAMNLMCIQLGLIRSVRIRRLNLDTVVWVFVYLFFFLAPVVQIASGPRFPNTMPIEPSGVLEANLILLAWNVVYLLFRKAKPAERAEQAPGERARNSADRGAAGTIFAFVGPRAKLVFFVLSCLVFAVTMALFQLNYFLGAAGYENVVSDKSLLLIVAIGTQGILFANWLFAFDSWRSSRTMMRFGYFALSTVMVVNQLSPFNTNRSYLGFCIIMIVYLFYSHRVTSFQFVWIIVAGMLLVFPLLNLFRYGLADVELPSFYHLMFDQLTELHFDAYSNLIATFQYCASHGFSYGYRLLGVLLFFVPRSLWVTKPLSSGEEIGDFISANYPMDFNNLSNPLPSEFYLNFGWAGVLGGALLLAWLTNKWEASSGHRQRLTHALVAGNLFVIMRGDLMNAFAYCFGTYVILCLLPVLLTKRTPREERPWRGASAKVESAGSSS